MIHNQLKDYKKILQKLWNLNVHLDWTKSSVKHLCQWLLTIGIKHLPHFKLYLSECCCFVVNEIQQFKKQSEKFYFHYSGSSLSGRSSAGFLGQWIMLLEEPGNFS